jgi:ABC-type branched-subunit amino acid transport system substrate-binding protein
VLVRSKRGSLGRRRRWRLVGAGRVAGGFGDLESPCGEGDGGSASDTGVTEDAITIGYGDDAGYAASPGVSHEASDAIEAFMKWCNDQGGINGREIKGNYYDAKILDVSNAATRACDDGVFMLVGQAWALDASQEETRLGCELPSVPTYSVSADFAMAPLMYVGVPNPVDFISAGFSAIMAREFPEESKKAGMIYGNFSATIDTKEKVTSSYPKIGVQFPCEQAYNISGEADWKPIVQKLKDCGAEIVYFSGQAFPNGYNAIEAANQLGYDPIWMFDANNYLESFAEWNTHGLGDKVYVRSAFVPFEFAEDHPVVQQFVDIVEGNGGDVSQLGQQAASSFLLWASAVKECGADVTRQCVLDELAKVTSWTGGGLHAETNPGENMPPECTLVLKLDGTEWTQAYPADKPGEYECDPSWVVEISGRVVDSAELNDERISTKYLK